MRIALVNEFYPPHASGGADWSTQALARALARRGHGVVVMTPRWGSPDVAPALEDTDGVRVHRFRVPFVRPQPPGPPAAQKVLLSPAFYAWASLRLARLARIEQVDVVHVQNKHMLIPAVLARVVHRRPVLLTIRDASLIDPRPMCLHHHDRRPADCGVRKLWRECAVDYDRNYTRGRHALLRTRLAFLYGWLDATLLRQRALRRVDAVVGVSDGILGIYERSGLLRHVRRRETIPTIPPLAVAPGEEEGTTIRRRYGLDGRVVLFVGRMSIGKGAADLLAAAGRLHARRPDLRLVVVGDRSNVGVPDVSWVRCLGRLPNVEVLALYTAADVVAVPSVIPDALSRVVLEAMAAGRPVVGTAVGGTPELIADRETGLLVPRHDPAALAEAIGQLLDDPALAARMGAAARKRVETRFSPEASVERHLALYAAVQASA
jgi:glycosyltransferase involved in cell wall biosynthesis